MEAQQLMCELSLFLLSRRWVGGGKGMHRAVGAEQESELEPRWGCDPSTHWADCCLWAENGA